MLRKALLTASLVGMLAASGVANAGTKLTLIQPNNGTMGFYGLHVARVLGYYEEEGVELKLLNGDTSVPYVAFLTNGNADLAMLDGPQTFQAKNEGVGTKTVYTVMLGAPEGVFVSKDSPIQSVTELKGKTVGLASDRDAASLAVAMAHAGSDSKGIKTVIVGDAGPTLANVFLKGTAAAFAGSINDLAALEARGIPIRDITPKSAKNAPANTYSMLAKRMDELKKPLCGFFRAYSKAVYVGTQDLEMVASMSRHPDGVPHEWESASFGYKYLDAVDDLQINADTGKSGKIGHVDAAAWKGVMKDMLMIGAIDKKYDVNSFISNDFIGCANDFDKAEVMAEASAWMADPKNAKYTDKSKWAK
ncbi:MAG: ABC transporter substrate-binding protein [Alphaproteobacteria bacterium]|jgi:NitT/TauT family transport system substrate-binding protein|nr:ABC transporter substrate-binding protein [Alphaproteobacteria bacterium]